MCKRSRSSFVIIQNDGCHREKRQLTIIDDCGAGSVSALSAFALTSEIDWTDFEALSRYLFDFVSAITLARQHRLLPAKLSSCGKMSWNET